MNICIFYTSPKLGDLILQLPFFKAIADKYNTKVTLCINRHIGIKNILEKQKYIDSIIENSFRRGKYFFYDILDLTKELKKKDIQHAYILEKTKGTAIACKLAGIKNIYGFGIGSQKYFVNRLFRLEKKDLRFNYTEQSIKFLSKLGISNKFNENYLILDENDKQNFNKDFVNLPKPWVCLGVDSTEINRIWPQKNFSKLSDNLIKKNLAGTLFVINFMDHKNYFQEIIDKSLYKKRFIDCKSLNRFQIIHLIDMCDYFIGIDSGPSCVAGALGKNTFCIIGPTDKTLPRFTSMKKITSDIYDKSREVGINRCGDNFVQNDFEVKTISVQKVFDTIVKFL